jgi:hypothetical protein
MPPEAANPQPLSPADALRGRLMRASLTTLLDRVNGSRTVLPHLAALEAGLQKKGPAVIDGISRPVLAKICTQLSSLPLASDDQPLQDLMGRLMTALEALQPPPQFLSDFMTDSKVVVGEASHTDFMAASEDPPRRS